MDVIPVAESRSTSLLTSFFRLLLRFGGACFREAGVKDCFNVEDRFDAVGVALLLPERGEDRGEDRVAERGVLVPAMLHMQSKISGLTR